MDTSRIYENPVSRTREYIADGTLEARLANVQKLLAEQNLDVLIVLRKFENTDRWLCNAFGCVEPSGGYAAVFRTGRALCTDRNLVTDEAHSEDRNGSISCDSNGRFINWASEVDIIDFLEGHTKQDLPGTEGWIHPTCDLVHELAEQDLLDRAGSIRRVGVVDPENVPASLMDFLKKHFPEAEVVDATQAYCQVKAVKSQDDLELMREIAKQHDAICGAVGATLLPGTLEREIFTKAKYAAYRQGAGGFNWLTGVPTTLASFPMNGAWDYAPKRYPGRAIAEGDCVLLRIQSPGISGYNGAIGRCWTLGEPKENIKARWSAAVEAEDYCASLLQPGKTIAQVKAELLKWMDGKGYDVPRGHYLHGIGYELEELPSATGPLGELKLEAGMTMRVAVPVAMKGEMISPFVCEDMFVVTAEGGQRLTRFPREIIVV